MSNTNIFDASAAMLAERIEGSILEENSNDEVRDAA
jgi:hypothetical protein